MELIGRSALLILTIGVPLVASAADPSIQAAETSVRLGLVGGYAAYSRIGPGTDGQIGGFVGVTAGFSDLSPSSVPEFLLPDFYTNVGYEFSDRLIGGPHGGGARIDADENGYKNTATIRLGAGTPITSRMELIPYVLAGYQNWSRNGAGPGGYGEFYQAAILGGGLRLDLAGSPRVVVSASAEGYAVIGGAGSGRSQDFDEGLGASAEERVSLDADYRLNRTWHAFAGLGVNHFEYDGAKSAVSGFGGAGGTALQISSMFGLTYGF